MMKKLTAVLLATLLAVLPAMAGSETLTVEADVPLHDGHVAYHLRTGLHDITRYDWQCYMDFAEGKGW